MIEAARREREALCAVGERCLREELGRQKAANARHLSHNPVPEFLVKHFIAKVANQSIERLAACIGYQSHLIGATVVLDEHA